jgi:3-hydroxybutyrate dehydrogenase
MTKTAIITGGTSGIGLGYARAFAEQGYNLVLNGLEKNGEKITGDVGKEFSVKTLFIGADLRKPQQIQDMVKKAEKEFGQIHVLINNAGVQHVAPLEKFPEEKWDLILAVNLSAAFHCSKAVWPAMKENGFGRIINTASAHGLRASEYKSAYVASKHGIIGLTKVLALEGAEHGITANAICPGYVKTELVEKQIKDQAQSHGISEKEVVNEIMLSEQAIKEFAKIEDLGALALFLASDHASMITGTALPVDGGWTAQ